MRQGDWITMTVRRMEVFEGSGSRVPFSGFLRAEEEAFGLCAGSRLVVVELEIYETERWIEKKKTQGFKHLPLLLLLVLHSLGKKRSPYVGLSPFVCAMRSQRLQEKRSDSGKQYNA